MQTFWGQNGARVKHFWKTFFRRVVYLLPPGFRVTVWQLGADLRAQLGAGSYGANRI
jgi:hypothetical protein